MKRFVMTNSLIGINGLIWIATVLSGLDMLSPDGNGLLNWGGNRIDYTLEQPWRLLTATFLHVGIIHLAMNMLSLHSVGRIAELFYGPRNYLLLYLVSGLWGSIASLFFGASQVVSVGASGAIFGISGAMLAAIFSKGHLLNPEFVKSLRNSLLFFTVFSLYMGFTVAAVDNAAHIGGLLAGAVCGWVLPESFDTGNGIKKGHATAALLLIVALALALAVIMGLRV
jgi:rhomboid protease GluP